MADRRLSEETRQQLLGLLPFSVGSTIEFTPERFGGVEEEFRPGYTIRGFTQEESTKVKKLLRNVKDANEEELNEYARMIVMGWKNIFDTGTFEEIEYKADPAGGCDKDLFKIFPDTTKGDILFYGVKISGLIDPEKLGLK